MASILKPRIPSIDWGNQITKKLIYDLGLFEGAGTKVKNLVGDTKGSIFVGTPTWTVGEYGMGLDFNGTNNNIRTDPDTAIVSSVGQEFTMECMFVCDSLPGSEVIPMSNGADNAGFSISIESSTLKVLFNGVARISSGSGMTTGVLYHVFLRHTGGIVTLFKNGINVGPNSSNNAGSATEGLTLGVQLVDHTNYQRYFDGKIYVARLWERGITEKEIVTLTDNPFALYTDSSEVI